MHAEPTSPAEPPETAKQPGSWRTRPRPPLVKNVAGRPVILWRRVLAATALYILAIGLGQLLVFLLVGMPLNLLPVAIPVCMYLMLLVVLVERERHVILLGSQQWRISLAGVMLLVTIVSIMLAMFVADHQRVLRTIADRQAVEIAIRDLPGVTQVAANDDGVLCQIASSTFNDADLRRLAQLARMPGDNRCQLSHVFASGTAITDEGLAALADCPKLTLLDISGTAVTDAGLVHLANCRRLHTLMLQNTQVTADGLQALAKLPKLERVLVSGSPAAKGPAAKDALPGVEIFK